MLGTEQERWLGEQLAASTATWPVIAQQTVLTDVRLPNGAVLNYDQWDGYARRATATAAAGRAHAARTVVLTGDIHLAAVGTLPGVGIEFVSTSISSSGLVPADVIDGAVTGFPDIVDAELDHRGYTRHTVTPTTWIAEYRTVDDVADPASAVSTWQTFTVDAVGQRRRDARDGARADVTSPRWRTRHSPATAAGPTDVALLDETIGANLRRTIAAHGDREALVARHQGIRWTYAELGERVERLGAGPARARARGRRPGRARGAPTTPSGRCCSTPRPRSA